MRSIEQQSSGSICGYAITTHAERRMRTRGIKVDAVRAALEYGRVLRTRGAEIHVIGRREIAKSDERLSDDYEGIQVVCSDDASILTVYRNRNLRGLRPRKAQRTLRGAA